MKEKKAYAPAKVDIISVRKDDVIRTSGFNGPGVPLFPAIVEDPDMDSL